jgi:hypothetical protein
MIHTIHIPNWLPTSDNKLSGCHWNSARTRKIGDMNMIADCVYKLGIPKAQGKRMVEIVLTIGKGKRGRRPDPTNFYKSVMDALVQIDQLIDDNSEYMSHLPTRIEKGEITSTTIYLTDL